MSKNSGENIRLKSIQLVIFLLLPNILFAGIPDYVIQVGIYTLFGNLIYGLVEAIILNKYFKDKFWKTIPLVIFSNYFSWITLNTLFYYIQNYLFNNFVSLRMGLTYSLVSFSILLVSIVFIKYFIYKLFFKYRIEKKLEMIKVVFNANILFLIIMLVQFFTLGSLSFFYDLKYDSTIIDKIQNYDLYVSSNEKIYKTNFKELSFSTLVAEIEGKSNDRMFKLVKVDSLKTYDLEYGSERAFKLREYDSRKKIKTFQNYEEIISIETNFISVENYISFYGREKYATYIDFREDDFPTWYPQAPHYFRQLRIDYFDDGIQYLFILTPWIDWCVTNLTILDDFNFVFTANGRFILVNLKEKKFAELCKLDNYFIKKK